MQFKATTYLPHVTDEKYRLTGEQLLGTPCPTCGSKLVKRIRKSDGKQFVACDKRNKRFCKFTMGMYETLKERTDRINLELHELEIERMHEYALDMVAFEEMLEAGCKS